MHVRDKLAYVMTQPDAQHDVLFEWAAHVLPFCMSCDFVFWLCSHIFFSLDDIHSVKTVQEAFFKVVSLIQPEDNGEEAENNFWHTPSGQRVATLIARYLPSDQICAPYGLFPFDILYF